MVDNRSIFFKRFSEKVVNFVSHIMEMAKQNLGMTEKMNLS